LEVTVNDQGLQSQVDGAEAYERLMVPALFARWAPGVCGAARLTPGNKVLDIACGTGVLAREALRRVGALGRVSGLDPNWAMLEVARRLSPEVEWHQGVAESLPFPDDSLDNVVSQFGLMFFADRQTSLQEVVRVLKPGGYFALAVWDSLHRNPAYASEVSIVQSIAGDRAADPIRAPFQLGNADQLREVFIEAGIRTVNIGTRQEVGRFPSVRAMVEADLRGWLPVVGITLSEDEIGAILAESQRQLSSYVATDGTVEFPTSAHIAYGRVT
jgi:ubiquinone/menaquinone biosynthesis C-methylase UbiE